MVHFKKTPDFSSSVPSSPTTHVLRVFIYVCDLVVKYYQLRGMESSSLLMVPVFLQSFFCSCFLLPLFPEAPPAAASTVARPWWLAFPVCAGAVNPCMLLKVTADEGWSFYAACSMINLKSLKRLISLLQVLLKSSHTMLLSLKVLPSQYGLHKSENSVFVIPTEQEAFQWSSSPGCRQTSLSSHLTITCLLSENLSWKWPILPSLPSMESGSVPQSNPLESFPSLHSVILWVGCFMTADWPPTPSLQGSQLLPTYSGN